VLGSWGQLGARERTITQRRCSGCERPIADGRRRYHEEGCRKQHWRRRVTGQSRVGV